MRASIFIIMTIVSYVNALCPTQTSVINWAYLCASSTNFAQFILCLGGCDTVNLYSACNLSFENIVGFDVCSNAPTFLKPTCAYPLSSFFANSGCMSTMLPTKPTRRPTMLPTKPTRKPTKWPTVPTLKPTKATRKPTKLPTRRIGL
jgi:hypothetical protein